MPLDVEADYSQRIFYQEEKNSHLQKLAGEPCMLLDYRDVCMSCPKEGEMLGGSTLSAELQPEVDTSPHEHPMLQLWQRPIESLVIADSHLLVVLGQPTLSTFADQ